MKKQAGLAGSLVVIVVLAGSAVIVPKMLRKRVLDNEIDAILDARRIYNAQAGYASSNCGLYDSIECLAQPSKCIPRYPKDLDSVYLPPPLRQSEQVERGYRRAFHAGPPPISIPEGCDASPSSMTAFAYVLTPLQPGRSGRRWFCVDSRGLVFYLEQEPAQGVAKDGLCRAGNILMIALNPDIGMPGDVLRKIENW
jgi:hypothetical protein